MYPLCRLPAPDGSGRRLNFFRWSKSPAGPPLLALLLAGALPARAGPAPAPPPAPPPAVVEEAAVEGTDEAPVPGAEPAPAAEPVASPAPEPMAPEEPAAPAEEPSAKAEKRRETHEKAPDHVKFIKGELVHPGTRRLLSRFDHFGVAVGATVLDSDAYLTVTPGLALYRGRFAFSAGVPLNLLAFDSGTRALGSFKVRRQDWDEISDYARVLRFATYGRKEDRIYATINSLRPATIGHGLLVTQYNANIDIDRSMTGLMFDAYNDYAGFQLQANDVTFQNRVLAALVFVKPLAAFAEGSAARSLSLGFEYAGDLRAPRCVRFSAQSGDCVQGSGQRGGFDPYTGENLDRTFVRTDPDTGRFAVAEGVAHAAGFSGEIKVLKRADAADVKLYGTWHRFLNEGGGSGLAAGALGRFNTGELLVSAFRLRAEYRNFGDGYLPGYFDSLYEIQKYSYPTSSAGYQVVPTKWQAVFGDAANGFARPEQGRAHGFNLDLNWGLYSFGARGKMLSMGLGLQDSTRPGDTRFYAHLEFPLPKYLQLFGTYMRVNAGGLGDLVGAPLDPATTVVLTGLRLQLLPILFVNAHYSRSFRTTRTPESEYHLGNERVVDASGRPSAYFATDSLFENVQTLWVELELGWEMKRDRPEDVKGSRLGDPADQEGR